ncbi:MAG: 50S ribosomal protein L11 methyltransferase [Clostridiales bacterium]|nr:50S ribosomal protein L11 methyltransferase [Clostridiales bacterium]
MDWIEVGVLTTTAGAEAVSEALHRAGCAGTLIEDRYDVEQLKRNPGDWDYIDGSLLVVDGEVRVTGYLPEGAASRDALEGVRAALRGILALAPRFDAGSCALSIRTVRDEDWAVDWRRHYHPFPVGERLFIVPEWVRDPAPGGRAAVRINPGMAFGTGTHETTFMCLELLENAVTPGASVADVGCGTGILGIAALALGAGEALAVDRDPVCISAANASRLLNPGADRLSVRQGNLLDGVDAVFDVITTNIIANVVVAFAADAHRHLRPGGTLIASGILRGQADGVAESLTAAGFSIASRREMGEWAALLGRRQ